MATKSQAKNDPHIGESVSAEITVISFEDGSQYECADGVITKQIHPPDPPDEG